MKSRFVFIIICAFVFIQSYSQQEKGLFFSEYIANGFTNVLEIFNPTADTVDLSRYSIRRSGNDLFRFDFPGGELLPFRTWVGTRHEPDNPPDAQVLAVADTSWPAAGSIWFFSNIQMIELLKDNVVIDRINGDPRNGNVAGVPDALERVTLIRKPSVFRGEPDWDISRGTDADDSQWLVFPVSYYDLKKHSIDLTDPTMDTTTTISSGVYSIISDTIYLDEPLPLATVLQNISPDGAARFLFTDLLGNSVSSGFIRKGYMLKVTAEAGNVHYYIIYIDVQEDTLIEAESMVYVTGENSLSGISRGTPTEELLGNLLLFPSGVTARVTDTGGNPKTGGVDTGDLLELTALDGSTKKILVLNCHEPVSPSAFQVHQVAQPRILPPGAPAYSDVNFTSRWARTQGIWEGPEALPAAKSFHITNFRWVYITNNRSSYYPGIDQWISRDIHGNGFRISASLAPTLPDLPRGGGGRVFDSRAELADGSYHNAFCPNKPLGRQVFMSHVQTAISMGSNFSIQMDDPHSYEDEEGVCYCRYCKAKAAEWGLATGSKALKGRTMIEFWKWVQSETPKYTGIRIGYSCNNSSHHRFNSVTTQFDFMIGECDPRWSYGPDKYFSDERLSAEPLGKMQVFNLSVKGLVIEDPTLVWRNRSITGLGYGTGGNVIVPWDTWMHPPVEERRYFGSPEEYADLYGFIRANTRLLEGYETAFDYMPNYNDPRYGGAKPVTIAENNRAFAYVRAVPGDSLAAVVVHLVDWKESPEPLSMRVNIRPEYFFSGRDFGVYLLEPAPYDAGVHQSVTGHADLHLRPGAFRGAEHEAVYAPLRKITQLVPMREGDLISVWIDSIPTYAHLVLVPSGHPWRVTSEEYLTDQEGMIIKGHAPGDYTSELLSKLDRSPLTSWMVLNPDGLPVYGQIGENNELVALSPGGRELLRYALFEGDGHGMEVSYGLETVAEGSVYGFEGVAVNSVGEDYLFTLKNVSSEVFVLDTICISGDGFTIDYQIVELLPGSSAEFTLKFHPYKKGLHTAELYIRIASRGTLPFGLSLTGDGLAPGMEVYQEGKQLLHGISILEMGEVKVKSDRLISLTVVNTGNSLLEIHEIITSNPDILLTVDHDSNVNPGDTGQIILKFAPVAERWEAIQLTLLNNSLPFGEFLLNAEGFGLPLLPEIKVEYDGILFQNNTGIVPFGNVKTNTSVTREVILRNTGDDPLNITNVYSDMASFSIASRPNVLAPGESDTIIILFTPILKLNFSATITINSDDKNNGTFRFSVIGRGDDVTSTEKETVQQITVYPNPAVSFVHVKYPGTFSLRLMDISGKVWLMRTDCSGSYDLDLEGLQGIYFLEILNDKGVFVEKLIVK